MEARFAAALAFAALLWAGGAGRSIAESVTTYHNGADRHGAYVVPGLTEAAAANMHLDPAFNGAVSGNVYAQPLYWKPAGTRAGRVIVATESNVVEALDADAGTVVWQTQLPPPAPLSALPCGNINPEGVTGTPVIDPASGTIYFDAVTDVSGTVNHMVYALSAETGDILPGWPLNVASSLAALGQTFDPLVEGERGAALLLGGDVYLTYGGRAGDCGDYHGMVIQVKPATHAITNVWATRAVRGGIWAQGGTASDGRSIFTTTGNTDGATEWGDGEAIIRLEPGLAHSTRKTDYFAPSNWLTLDEDDADLGGTEALPISVPAAGGGAARQVIAFGKNGFAYLADRQNLGGIGGALAETRVSDTVIITAPAVYSNGAVTLVAIHNGAGLNCSGNGLSMLRIASGGGSPITEAWCAAFNGQGAPIVTTTDGSAHPLVWITGAQGDNLLHGFDAMTGAVVFAGGGAAGQMQNLRHFGTILAANNHLYVAGDNRIYAFGFK
jgi:hypothetical protein